MSRDISKFEKPELITEFIRQCNEKLGIAVAITCTDRTYQMQTALFAQGREPLEYVNKLRKLAGLGRIEQKQNIKVTWTMNSKHIVNLEDERLDNDKSRAFDFVIIHDGKAVWDVKADVNLDKIPDYQEAGQVAEGLGLVWGGKFRNPDYPHVELHS